MSGYGRNDDNAGLGGYNEVRTETYDKEYRSSGGSGLDNIKEKIPGTQAYKGTHRHEHHTHAEHGYGRDTDAGYGAGQGNVGGQDYGEGYGEGGQRGQRASHIVSDPVYGATDAHKTGVGAQAESAWHGAKAKIPGTQEHKLTQEGDRPYEGVRGEADLAAAGGGAGYGRHEAPVHGGHHHHEGAGAGTGYTSSAGTHGRDDLGPGSGNVEREGAYRGAGAGYDDEVTRDAGGERGQDEGGQSKLGQVFEKVKAAIPGTAENKEKKAYEGRY